MTDCVAVWLGPIIAVGPSMLTEVLATIHMC